MRRLLVGLAAVLILTACGAGADPAPVAAPPAPAIRPAVSTSAASSVLSSTQPVPTAPASLSTAALVADPVSLSVPSVGIDSALVELGRNPDGTVEVPSLDDPDAKPGWYRGSPAPGALGPAIILGHVDSRRFGPGVFYDLKGVGPGDPIDVGRADGTVAHFVVDAVQEVAKSDFPTLAVYGNIDHPGLRLITCGGVFDPDARSYESNVIVFASLVG